MHRNFSVLSVQASGSCWGKQSFASGYVAFVVRIVHRTLQVRLSGCFYHGSRQGGQSMLGWHVHNLIAEAGDISSAHQCLR